MYSTSDAEYCECGAALKVGLTALPGVAAREVQEKVCCRLCHIDNVPLAPASFRANAGFVIFRVKEDLVGYFCEHCIDDAFWKQHTLSAIFGWWGVISFASNLFHIPFNLLKYLSALHELSPKGPFLNVGSWIPWAVGLSSVVVGFTWWLGRYESDTLFRAGFAAFWWSIFVLIPLGLSLAARAWFRSKAPVVV